MRPDDLTIAEIKAMLCDRIDELARMLAPGGKRQGIYWLVQSPLRENKKRSFAIWMTHPRGAWKDFGSGDKGDVIDLIACLAPGAGCPPSKEARGKALAWARDWLGVSGQAPAAIKAIARRSRENSEARARKEEQDRLRRQRRAFDLWLAGKRMSDTPGEAYLLSRSIDARSIPNLEHSIRFHPRIQHPLEAHIGPVMMSKFSTPAGDFAALHMTFLREDGRGKADVDKAKIILGSFAGAAVRISKGASGLSAEDAAKAGIRETLVICEGIEDGLTIAQARNEYRVWSAGSLDNVGNQSALPFVSQFLNIADNDTKAAAQKAHERAVEKLRRTGLPVTVARALGAAKDLNDLLRGAA